MVAMPCLSTDGRYALSGSGDYAVEPVKLTVKLWEVASGRCLRTLERRTEPVRSVCLSADGRHALSGSADGTVKLWEVGLSVDPPAAPYLLSRVQATQELLSRQMAYEKAVLLAKQGLEQGQPVEAARHLREARAVPGYSSDPEALELWRGLYGYFPERSFHAGWEAVTLEGHTGHVSSVSVSGDGRHALSGSYDGTLKLWDVPSGRCLRTFEGHKVAVRSVCLT
jgi:WD40 repeat protein